MDFVDFVLWPVRSQRDRHDLATEQQEQNTTLRHGGQKIFPNSSLQYPTISQERFTRTNAHQSSMKGSCIHYHEQYINFG